MEIYGQQKFWNTNPALIILLQFNSINVLKDDGDLEKWVKVSFGKTMSFSPSCNPDIAFSTVILNSGLKNRAFTANTCFDF